MKKTVPLTYYNNGERIVIGSCEVEGSEETGFDISGVIENEKYKGLLENKDNPDRYSIAFDRDDDIIETTYLPPMSVPSNPAFKARIPPND